MDLLCLEVAYLEDVIFNYKYCPEICFSVSNPDTKHTSTHKWCTLCMQASSLFSKLSFPSRSHENKLRVYDKGIFPYFQLLTVNKIETLKSLG